MEKKCMCRFKETDRTGLYVMVWLILMQTCSMKPTDTTKIDERLSRIEQRLEIVHTPKTIPATTKGRR